MQAPITAKSLSPCRRAAPIASRSLKPGALRWPRKGSVRRAAHEEAGKRDVRRVFERLGVVQIDSVNVLARAHTLPAFSRLGRYRTQRPARAGLWRTQAGAVRILGARGVAAARRAAAAAALAHGAGGARRRDLRCHRAVRPRAPGADRAGAREIAERGPLAAGELSHQHKGEGGWWGWSDGKRAVEWLFWSGAVTTATRRGTFERVYGLTEQVLPRSVIETPTPDGS